jgi:methyl-accepting chemotaxis protein
MPTLSNSAPQKPSGSAGPLSNTVQTIESKIKSYKTYKEVASSFNDLTKSAGDSASNAIGQTATQLNKIKDQQKRYLRDATTSMDNLLGFLDGTRGSGSSTMKYLRKTVLEAAAKIEPKMVSIVKDQTIKALGCSQEQTYKGVSPVLPDGTPSPLGTIPPISQLPQATGIYIPVQSIDFFSNLKNSPQSKVGKIYYEKADPSGDDKFRPYGGNEPFPMNKQLYQLMDSQNVDKSFSQINGKNYQGKSGQNLFDVQYTTTNSFGVTGDYYRMVLIDRFDEDGKVQNNVGEFISDYYSTLKLIDTTDITSQLVNLLSGAISIKGEIGVGEIENQSKFDLIVQRILGLCFDSRREIDVSGIAKIPELDGVDDSFFELTEVDLRNIEINISNIQNGVMEFEDCENVKLPVDYESLTDELVSLRDSEMTIERQVSAMESIIDSISQNPDWNLPPNFNASVAIDKNVIKKIPMAIAAGILTPKTLLPLYTLMSVVQSAATYTYNQNVTSANTFVSSANTFSSSANTITSEVSNIVTSGADFLKKYKTFSTEVISKINEEFLKVLFEILKRDIINLVSSIIVDTVADRYKKKMAMILKLIQIAMIISQLVEDYRKCKSLLDNILLLLNLIGGIVRPQREIPLPLLLLSSMLPGISGTEMTINAIAGLQSAGMPTGPMPDGSPNLMMVYNLVSNNSTVSNIAENGKIETIGTGGLSIGKLI